jgi:Fur family ferric uptake transcriptional regulator
LRGTSAGTRLVPMPPGATDIAAVKQQLRTVGLRATSARAVVLRALMTADKPLSHAEASDRVRRQGLDRATVYRNLMDLVEAGLAQRSDLGDHVWRFSHVADPASRPHEAHPHFVCTECGQVQCLPEKAVAIAKARRVPKAVRQRHVAIQVRGRCDDCDD